jgi:hypothetical protein
MGLKKLGTWLKKNIKPIAAVAAVVFPPLIPAIGAALVPAGASAVVTAAAGAAALSGAASAVATKIAISENASVETKKSMTRFL